MDQDGTGSSNDDLERDHSSAFSDSGKDSQPRSIEEQKEIAAAETRAVFRLKILVLAVLAASMVGVSLVVYYYMSRAEISNFENSFDSDSDKVFENVGNAMDLTLEAVDSFVVATASYAEATNSSWPFVTLPNFAVRVAKIRSLTKAVCIGMYQYVTEAQRREWQNYSMEHSSWVDQGIAVQKQDPTYKGSIIETYNKSDTIYGNNGNIPYGQGSYLPNWQTSPVVPTYPPFNWDGYEYPSLVRALPELVHKHHVVIGAVTNLPNPNDPSSAATVAEQNNWLQGFLAPNDVVTEPTSDMTYPIIDTAADQVDIRNDSQAKAVSFLAVTFYWRDLLTGILPAGTEGIVAVF